MTEKGAKVKFVAETGEFNESIRKANAEIKQMTAELKLNSKQMTRTGENVDGLEKKHKLLENQLKASQDKTEALNQKIAKAIEFYGENSTEVMNLKTQLANAKTEQEKFKIMLQSCNDKLEEQRAKEAELNSETKKLTDAISKQESELADLKKEYIETSLKYGDTSDEAVILALEIHKLSTKLEANKEKMSDASKSADEFDRTLNKIDDSVSEAKTASEELSETIAKQEAELAKLKKQYADYVIEGKGATAQAKDLETAINNLSTELKTNKGYLTDASNKANKLDRSFDDVEESTEETSDGFTVMKGAIGNLVADGISSLISGIGEVISSFANLSEETQEYREDINKLSTAFEDAGHTTKQATDVYKELYSVFGEEDRAVEASQQIANISKNEEDMARMTEIATGAWARWGDSLATESLMEAISASAKMSSVQGTLADALDWGAEEGEMFGLVLQENIEFTELSAKELKGLTEQQKEEYETRKKQHESIEEYNQKITDASFASELFTIALEECATEEERTALILDTLDGLYSNSAKLYKENNKSIIASRKATSDYNDTLADLGEELEPLNTEFTEIKTELLKGLVPTVKKEVIPSFKQFTTQLKNSDAIEDFSDMVGDLAGVGLPMLADVLGFVTENYKELTIGIGLTVVAFKTMSIVNTVTTAIKGATTAMGAFNAIMDANPIGAIVTVVGTLAVGVLALKQNTEETIDAMGLFNTEEIELIETTQATSEAIQETKASIDETSASLTAEMEHTKLLADELTNLADKNGKVQEADRTRAQFILNELNEALGTEYTMVDGVIQKYDSLEKSIYDVIDAKTANALLEAKNEEYVAAIQGENEALQQVNENYDLYQQKLESSKQAEEEYRIACEEYQKKLANAKTEADYLILKSDANKVVTLQANADKEKAMLDEAKKAYDDALFNYGAYQNDIMEYENASMLVQEGNYEDAIKMLQNKGSAYFEYSDDVSQATKDAVDALYQEAVQAGIQAERTKTNFENGVEGYTEEMVKEAEQGYEDALNEWANAYSDANSVGEDLGDGLKDGMESKKNPLMQKARDIVSNIISSMRKEADSHSPSRKTIAFGEDMGEGTEIGLDNKTNDIVQSAKNQVSEVMKAYDSELTKPLTFGGFGEIPMERNAPATIERNINNSSLTSLISAVEELANRPILLKINDRTIATATASASDSVNGLRNTFKDRGLILE